MKILITEPEYFSEKAVSEFKKLGEVDKKRVSHDELLKIVGSYDILVVRIETQVDEAVMNAGKNLKAIASVTTGIDHIDVAAAAKRGIKVVNLSGAHSTPTAEFAFALILSLLRKIPWAFNGLIQKGWSRRDFIGWQLEGKTLGIIGLGRIGRQIAEFAKSFNVKILAFDPYVDADVSKKLDVKLVSLDELLRESDVVTVHAILTNETRNMLGKEQLGAMKKSAFLVNMSRGEIVNEMDLLDALEKNKIAGAAVDVFTQEPLEKDSAMINFARTHDNLLITPHLGASTFEAAEEAAIDVAKKVYKEIAQ